jgi:hypothetical protein
LKPIIERLKLDDFHERKLPEPVTRNKEFSEVQGKADVVIGMRRAGKTWFCYQKIKYLIASGIKKKRYSTLTLQMIGCLNLTLLIFRKFLMSISVNIPGIEMAGAIFSLMRYSALINGKCS